MLVPLLITGGVLGALYVFGRAPTAPRASAPAPIVPGPSPSPGPAPTPPSSEGPVGNFLADMRVRLDSEPFRRPYTTARADADRIDLEREAESLGLTNVTTSLDPTEPQAALFQRYRLGYTGPRDRVLKMRSFEARSIRGPFQAVPS